MVYLFDLFDTLLNVSETNFNHGLEILWQKYFKTVCSYTEFAAFNDKLYLTVQKNKSANKEFPFVSHYVPSLCRQFNIPNPIIDVNTEQTIAEAVSQHTVSDETIEKLKQLKKQNSHIYILTNSMFRAAALAGILEKFKISRLTDKIFSSADFLLRKPDNRFFLHAIHHIKNNNHCFSPNDIIFIGNSYKHDVIGGCGAGLNVVWLNTDNTPNFRNLPIRTINNISQL